MPRQISDLDALIDAIGVAFRLADEDRAIAILSQALRALVRPVPLSPPLGAPSSHPDRQEDSLGAPIRVRQPIEDAADWEHLRHAVRATIAEIGWPEAARRFGGNPSALRDLVYRTREPGIGRRSRLGAIIAPPLRTGAHRR